MIYIVSTTQGSWSECEESCFGGFQLGCTQQAESDQGPAQRGSSSGAWELKFQGVKPILPETLPSYITRHRRGRSWSVKLRWDPSNMKLMMDLIFARWGFRNYYEFRSGQNRLLTWNSLGRVWVHVYSLGHLRWQVVALLILLLADLSLYMKLWPTCALG